jgi:hypothetical protein
MSSLFTKAIITGIVFVFLGIIISCVFKGLKPVLPSDCEIWNKYYVMEISLFVSGFIFRYLLENEVLKEYIL